MQDEDSSSTSKASVLKSIAAITKKRSNQKPKQPPSPARQNAKTPPRKAALAPLDMDKQSSISHVYYDELNLRSK